MVGVGGVIGIVVGVVGVGIAGELMLLMVKKNWV